MCCPSLILIWIGCFHVPLTTQKLKSKTRQVFIRSLFILSNVPIPRIEIESLDRVYLYRMAF